MITSFPPPPAKVDLLRPRHAGRVISGEQVDAVTPGESGNLTAPPCPTASQGVRAAATVPTRRIGATSTSRPRDERGHITDDALSTDIDRSEKIRLSLTGIGMVMLGGVLIAQTTVVTSLHFHHDLAWSWFVQNAAVGLGIGIGIVIGWRAMNRMRAQRALTPVPQHRTA